MPNNLEKLKYIETKDALDKVSPSFCLAKWLQVTIHLQNGQTHSCHHPPTHKVPLSELKENPAALHNTKEKINQRRAMLRGEKPKPCHYCWDAEKASPDNFSDRVFKSSSSWAMPFLEKTLKDPLSDRITPRYLEVSFGHKCNFKCSYCAPHISSSLFEETKRFGKYPVEDAHDLKWLDKVGLTPIPPEDDNPYVDAFWKWLPEIYQDLRVLRITGGEPLVNPNTFKLLEYMKEHPSDHLDFAMNSNLGLPKSYIQRLKKHLVPLLENKHVKRVNLFTSIDTWGADAEYIRNGLNCEEFEQNLIELFESSPEMRITIMCTFNVLSVPRFHELIEKVLEWKKRFGMIGNDDRLIFDISHLTYPRHQAFTILPASYESRLGELFELMKLHQKKTHLDPEGFTVLEVEKMKRILEIFRDHHQSKDPQQKYWQKQFQLFFTEYDKRKGTSLKQTFPDYSFLGQQSILQDFKNKFKYMR
ncbi:MAG: twitch domain-containing radical SAM protein [Bacteriovoracaceae bacterium]|nr:twitch domain-containing radical SAM protein [Bacteriovoracaceae bacterium]